MTLKEENPFENENIAKEWIKSVEGEKDSFRDQEIYPRLKRWISNVKPQITVEIGSGQGICSNQLGSYQGEYIGIEPSETLLKRAKELYGSQPNVNFILGNAYELPIVDQSADAIFSINVWFHLQNLIKASQEIRRILKPNGNLLIITANPNAYDIWESLFFDYKNNGKRLDGKVKLPVTHLSRNIFYLHSLEEVKKSFTNNGLLIESIEAFAPIDNFDNSSSFNDKKDEQNQDSCCFIAIKSVRS